MKVLLLSIALIALATSEKTTTKSTTAHDGTTSSNRDTRALSRGGVPFYNHHPQPMFLRPSSNHRTTNNWRQQSVGYAPSPRSYQSSHQTRPFPPLQQQPQPNSQYKSQLHNYNPYLPNSALSRSQFRVATPQMRPASFYPSASGQQYRQQYQPKNMILPSQNQFRYHSKSVGLPYSDPPQQQQQQQPPPPAQFQILAQQQDLTNQLRHRYSTNNHKMISEQTLFDANANQAVSSLIQQQQHQQQQQQQPLVSDDLVQKLKELHRIQQEKILRERQMQEEQEKVKQLLLFQQEQEKIRQMAIQKQIEEAKVLQELEQQAKFEQEQLQRQKMEQERLQYLQQIDELKQQQMEQNRQLQLFQQLQLQMQQLQAAPQQQSPQFQQQAKKQSQQMQQEPKLGHHHHHHANQQPALSMHHSLDHHGEIIPDHLTNMEGSESELLPMMQMQPNADFTRRDDDSQDPELVEDVFLPDNKRLVKCGEKRFVSSQKKLPRIRCCGNRAFNAHHLACLKGHIVDIDVWQESNQKQQQPNYEPMFSTQNEPAYQQKDFHESQQSVHEPPQMPEVSRHGFLHQSKIDGEWPNQHRDAIDEAANPDGNFMEMVQNKGQNMPTAELMEMFRRYQISQDQNQDVQMPSRKQYHEYNNNNNHHHQHQPSYAGAKRVSNGTFTLHCGGQDWKTEDHPSAFLCCGDVLHRMENVHCEHELPSSPQIVSVDTSDTRRKLPKGVALAVKKPPQPPQPPHLETHGQLLDAPFLKAGSVEIGGDAPHLVADDNRVDDAIDGGDDEKDEKEQQSNCLINGEEMFCCGDFIYERLPGQICCEGNYGIADNGEMKCCGPVPFNQKTHVSFITYFLFIHSTKSKNNLYFHRHVPNQVT